MQFTTEVNWELADFVVFGSMLTLACGADELATRTSGDTAYRAAVARLRPRGMTGALAATALAQAVVSVIAAIAGLGATTLWTVTLLYVALWLTSADLFWRAAQKQVTAGSTSG